MLLINNKTKFCRCQPFVVKNWGQWQHRCALVVALPEPRLNLNNFYEVEKKKNCAHRQTHRRTHIEVFFPSWLGFPCIRNDKGSRYANNIGELWDLSIVGSKIRYVLIPDSVPFNLSPFSTRSAGSVYKGPWSWSLRNWINNMIFVLNGYHWK